MENYLENNSVLVGGEIIEEVEFSHEIYDEKFYKFAIKSTRLSGQEDILPVIISERIMEVNELLVGKRVKIEGQFRSYNLQQDIRNKLILSIFVKQIEFDDSEEILTLNEATFDGFICKQPVYRKTPLGREIADILVAVNRNFSKKSDYIPCILWGRNAKFCRSLAVGTEVKLVGRIQSRTYEKLLINGEYLKKTAYEVSISQLSKVEKDAIEETEEASNE